MRTPRPSPARGVAGRRYGGGRRRGGGGLGRAGAFLSGLAFLLLTRELDGPLARGVFFRREAAGGRRCAGGARGWRRRGGPGFEQALFGRGRRGEVAGARIVGPGALGLDDHRLGSAVAEALLHRAGADRPGPARLQGQGRTAAGGGGVTAVVVLVAHALALLSGRTVRPNGSIKRRQRDKCPALRLLAPTLWKERTETGQPADIFGPSVGGSPRKEGGVYHILQP